jgi:glycosyltransferase involved in cell wall biosynthesis
MRVLALATTIDKPEAYIFAGLAQAGVKVFVIATPIPEHRALLTQAGVEIFEYAFSNRFDLKGIQLIRRIVKDHRIDVIYALSNRGLSCSVLGLMNREIPIMAYRGTVGHLSRLDPTSWLTYLNPKVKKIMCVSQAVQQYLLDLGISADKAVLVYKGHDTAWYQTAPPPRASLGIPEDAFVVGCTAVMRPVKGVDILIEAVTSLLKELPQMHLLLIGSIKDPAIEKLIASFPDPSRLHLTGYRTDATQLARISDVVVMASKTREGFPKSIIEAMSQGVPAIVTQVGGMPELVGHGSAGVMIPPSDAPALAAAIRKLYNDPGQTNALGLLGQTRIREVFNINTTIQKTFETIKSLTRQRTEQMMA